MSKSDDPNGRLSNDFLKDAFEQDDLPSTQLKENMVNFTIYYELSIY